jgi:CheY-like chemotaxis protein
MTKSQTLAALALADLRDALATCTAPRKPGPAFTCSHNSLANITRDYDRRNGRTWFGAAEMRAFGTRFPSGFLDVPGARFDAALVDQYMPAMTGWELLQELHERPSTADLPVFLMSAADPERPHRLDPAIGFDAVLRKPFTSSELADLLGMSLGIEWVFEPSAV